MSQHGHRPTASRGSGAPPGVRLAVDVGSVRIGVARSDPRGVLASPLVTVGRGRGDAEALAALVQEHGAVEVIVGLPATLSGREGAAATDAREFAARLATRLGPIPVRLVDERLSTVAAHGALRETGMDERRRRRVADRAAAAVVLQTALDRERATGEPAGELVDLTQGGAR